MEPWPIEFDTGRPAWIGIRSIPSPAAVPSLNPSDFGDPPEDDLLPNHLCQIDRETWRVGASWSEASFCLFLPWGNPHETPMKCYEIIGQPQPNSDVCPMFVPVFFFEKNPQVFSGALLQRHGLGSMASGLGAPGWLLHEAHHPAHPRWATLKDGDFFRRKWSFSLENHGKT